MKEITLTQGKVALVDDADYDWLNQFNWYASRSRDTDNFYAMREDTTGKVVLMHCEILGLKGVDHRNGNGLDNRTFNLRPATKTQNNWNRGAYKNNKSGFKGVYWIEGREKWLMAIQANKKRIHGGYFNTDIEAAAAYNYLAKKLHGEFAFLNDLSEVI
jgi:hypothetical protein